MLRQLSRRLGQTRWTADSERTVCDHHSHYHHNWQQRRCLSQHIDLDSFKANSRRIISQSKSPEPQINLCKALTGFIPPTINNDHGDCSIEQSANLIIPGFHFVYCNEMIPPSHLLPDGTDDLHCPSPHGDFMFRLWAGGDISFARNRNMKMKKPTTAATSSSSSSTTLCLGEQVVDAKMVDGGEKIFVKVRRTLVECPFSSITDDGNDDSIRKIALDLDAAKKLNPIGHHTSDGDGGDDDDDVRLHLVENRWLCFTRTRPATTESNEAPETETKLPTCPSNGSNSKVDFHWLVTPDAALLFRFSALTLNAHAIHLDREYTRRVYGLPDLVVHGPLTVCLMMQVLLCALRRYEAARGRLSSGRHGQLVIDSLSYTNIAPLYVDQTMKICVKEPSSPSEENATGNQVWAVWISKKVDGVWRVAVRANAKVGHKQLNE